MTSSRVVAEIDAAERGNPGPTRHGMRIENAIGDGEHVRRTETTGTGRLANVATDPKDATDTTG